jgi:tetratricopeptide (TPR) repeat protein
LLDFQQIEIDAQFFEWRSDHDHNRLLLIEEIFSNLPNLWKSDFRYLSIRAICHFVLHKNIQAARELVKKAGTIEPKHPTWRYSLAFLDAYEDDIDGARSLYQAAFRSDSTNQVSLEVEEFIIWSYEVDPTKVQLLYFLGLINFQKKKDFTSAKRDLTAFSTSQHSQRYPLLRTDAQRMIDVCSSEIDATPKI